MTCETSKQQPESITSAETHKEYLSGSVFHSCQTRLKMLSILAMEDRTLLLQDDDMFSGFVNILEDLNGMLELAIDKTEREYNQILEELILARQQP